MTDETKNNHSTSPKCFTPVKAGGEWDITSTQMCSAESNQINQATPKIQLKPSDSETAHVFSHLESKVTLKHEYFKALLILLSLIKLK